MIRSWLTNWAPLSPAAFTALPRKDLPFPLAEPSAQMYACGRHCVWHGIRALGLGDGDEVLVPAYHAGPDVEALLRLGVRVRWYGGTPDLEPDPAELERLLTPATRALYLIHHLGFAADAPRWRRWCDERGMLLMEDAAQGFMSELDGRPLGSFGDFGFTCAYKKLPVPNGAYALCRKPLEPPTGRRPFGWSRNWEPVDQRGSVAHELAAWAGQRVGMIGALRSRLLSSRLRGDPKPFDPAEHAQIVDVNEQPTRLSLFLMPRVARRSVREIRRRNYSRLLDALGDYVVGPFGALTPGACPWFFPVRTPSPGDAVLNLLQHGVSTIHYWAAGHPAIEDGKFPNVLRRRATTLAVPVHQGLSTKDVDRIAEAVLQVLPEIARRASSRT
jgi:selenocysteine lyase/cysteine desulfurase